MNRIALVACVMFMLSGLARGQTTSPEATTTAATKAGWDADVRLSTNNDSSVALNENMGQCLLTNGDTVHVVWEDFKDNGKDDQKDTGAADMTP